MNRIRLVFLALALMLGLHEVKAQQGNPQIASMTGDRNAVWIATTDNRLIYCWWPQDPARLDKQASCRMLDRFKVDLLQ